MRLVFYNKYFFFGIVISDSPSANGLKCQVHLVPVRVLLACCGHLNFHTETSMWSCRMIKIKGIRGEAYETGIQEGKVSIGHKK
jgi:hypothetical protein